MMIVIDQPNIGTRMPCADNSTLTLTTTATVASGGFIVFFAHWFLTGRVLSSVTGGGLSWNIDVQGFDAADPNMNAAIVSAQAPAGLASGTVLTATWDGTASSISLGAMSFTGVKTSSPLDTTAAALAVTPAAAGWTTRSASIQAGSALVATSWDQDGISGTSTPTAPSLEAFDVLDCGVNVKTAAYRIESSAGSYTVAGTYSSNTRSVTVGAAYLAEPAGGAQNQLAWIRA